MSQPRIYVLEDDVALAEEIRERLTRLGYEVCGQAVRGEQALEEIPQAHPDLVLVETMLHGGMTGIQLAAQLRPRSNAPVVFLGTCSNPREIQDAVATGPFGYLVKPFNERQMHATLQAALGRHEAEARLRALNVGSETRFAAAFHRNPIGMGIRRLRDDTIVEANDSFFEMFGRRREEVVGQAVSSLAFYVDPEQRKEVLARLARREDIQGMEIQFHAAGQCLDTVMTVSHLTVDQEDYALATFVDITERKRMQQMVVESDVVMKETEAALRENEARLKDAQRIGHLGFLDWDLGSDEILLSPETLRIFGLDEGHARSTLAEVADLLHPEDRSRVEKSLFDAAQGIARYDLEHRMVRPDGTEIHVLATAELLPVGPNHQARLLGTVLDITERKQLELRLQRSEALAHVGSFEVDYRTNRIWWSDETFRILGVAPDVAPSFEAYLDAVHPDDRDRADEILRELRRTFYDGEFRVVASDGRLRHVRAQGCNTFDEHGKPLRTAAALQDVSELMRPQLRLRNILDSMFVFVGVFDLQGNVIDVNRAPLEAARLTHAEVVGKPFWDTYWWSYSPALQQELRAALARAARGEMVRSEYAVRVSKERFMVVDTTFGPLRDAAGRIEGIVGSAADVTDRHRLTQRLSQAQALAHLGSWELDLGTNTLWWSDEQYRIHGIRTGTPLSQKQFLDLVHHEDRDRIRLSWDLLFRSGILSQAFRVVRPDGGVRHLMGVAKVECDTAGAPLAIWGTNFDVTEMTEAAEKLKALVEEKETLLKEIHHRVKNNLQVVSSLLALQSDAMVDPGAHMALQASITRVHAMGLIHEWLCQSETVGHIDFGEYARELTSFVFVSHRVNSRVKLVIDVEPCLLGVEMAVPCGLILSELVSNALKHSFAPGQPGELFVRVRAEPEGRFRMTVRDTGQGLPPGFDIREATSLGFQLVVSLTKQIQGTLAIENQGGLNVNVTFQGGRRPPR